MTQLSSSSFARRRLKNSVSQDPVFGVFLHLLEPPGFFKTFKDLSPGVCENARASNLQIVMFIGPLREAVNQRCL